VTDLRFLVGATKADSGSGGEGSVCSVSIIIISFNVVPVCASDEYTPDTHACYLVEKGDRIHVASGLGGSGGDAKLMTIDYM